VYSTKGTTWSGSPLWKETQQEVRQHWFIDSYIHRLHSSLYTETVQGYWEVQCTVQRVQPGRGHHCGRRRNKRYDNTVLLTVTVHISFYTGTVQGYWSTPDWSDRRPGV
jgi:hypothetical protein